jgi:hypothetical protein
MSKITNLRQRTISEKHVVGIACDACQKEISDAYFDVVTSHSDWGNDSIDSVENFDFCSLECLMPHMSAFFKKAGGTEQYEIERKTYK